MRKRQCREHTTARRGRGGGGGEEGGGRRKGFARGRGWALPHRDSSPAAGWAAHLSVPRHRTGLQGRGLANSSQRSRYHAWPQHSTTLHVAPSSFTAPRPVLIKSPPLVNTPSLPPFLTFNREQKASSRSGGDPEDAHNSHPRVCNTRGGRGRRVGACGQPGGGSGGSPPPNATAEALAPPGTRFIRLLINNEDLHRYLLQAKKRCFLPHTCKGCAGGPWPKQPGQPPAPAMPQRARPPAWHPTVPFPATGRASPALMMQPCKENRDNSKSKIQAPVRALTAHLNPCLLLQKTSPSGPGESLQK